MAGNCSFKFTLEEHEVKVPLVPMLSTGACRVDGAERYVATVLLPRLHVLGYLDPLFDPPSLNWDCSLQGSISGVTETSHHTEDAEEEDPAHPFPWQGARSGVWANEYKAARPDRTQVLTQELQRLRLQAKAAGTEPPACIQRPRFDNARPSSAVSDAEP
jgi:hypothetical protein